MNSSLRKYKLPKLALEEVVNLNKSIFMEKNKVVTESLLKNVQDPDGFTDELFQTFQEQIVSMLYKLVQNLDKERNCFSSLYEVSIHLTRRAQTSDQSPLKELTQNSQVKDNIYFKYFSVIKNDPAKLI